MMKISNFFAILFVIWYLTFDISAVLAAESSPSADIKAKLEQLKQDIASKAAQLKQEVNKKLQNRAYIGPIKVKSQYSLTLASNSGPKLVTINQDTNFESKVKKVKSYSFKNLTDGDFVATLGDIDDVQVLTAKKVLLLDPPKMATKSAVWGQIVSIIDDNLTIKNREKKSIYIDASKADQPKFKLNDFVIVSGTEDKENSIKASFIHVLQTTTSTKKSL